MSRRRGSSHVADYYIGGKRVRRSFKTREEARAAESRGQLKARLERGLSDQDPTLSEYAEIWQDRRFPFLKPGTRVLYEMNLRVHILPALGSRKLRSISRGDIKSFLGREIEKGLAKTTAGTLLANFRTILSEAVEDKIIGFNPASGLARKLKLHISRAEMADKVLALNREQVLAFLAAAPAPFYGMFAIKAMTGLRISEVLGLQWEDLHGKELRIQRKWSQLLEVETPKSGHGRTVDLGKAAQDILADQKRWLAAEWLRMKVKAERGPWVFPDLETGLPYEHKKVRIAFKRIAAKAGLEGCGFTPKAMRHTYASQMLADGASPAYVQEQMGHANIELTVGLYGRSLRKRAPGMVDAHSAAYVVTDGHEKQLSGTTGADAEVSSSFPDSQGNLTTVSHSESRRKKRKDLTRE